MRNIYFLHGLDSSGNGTKGQFFQKNYPQIQCPDFSGELQERLAQLERLCAGKEDLFFIGSSFGGLMAACFAIRHPARVSQLVLFAPALNYGGFTPPQQKISVPTLLMIGREDTVTPPDKVLPLAEKSFSKLTVQIEEDDHMLHKSYTTLNWQDILQ